MSVTCLDQSNDSVYGACSHDGDFDTVEEADVANESEVCVNVCLHQKHFDAVEMTDTIVGVGTVL